MDGFADFYAQPYPGTDQEQSLDGYAQDASMTGVDPNDMETSALGQAQTLQQIISQNNEELMRRRNNLPAQYRHGPQDHSRRASMMEFSSNMDSDLADFQFDPNPNESGMTLGPSNMMPMQKALDPRKVRSREDLSLNTQFQRMHTNYDNMHGVHDFSPMVLSSTSAQVEPSSAYIPPDMAMAMDFDSMTAGADGTAMQDAMFTNSPMHQSFPMPYPAVGHDPSGSMSPHVQNPMKAMAPGVSPAASSYPPASQASRRPPSLLHQATTSSGGPSSAMASPAHQPRAPARRLSLDQTNSYSRKGSYSKRTAGRPVS
jgi:hypothetical protein